MKRRGRNNNDGIRPEYDFDYSKAVRGKYYKRLLKEGANVVVLERDVAKAFRDSAAVNDALRSLLQLARLSRRLTVRASAPLGSVSALDVHGYDGEVSRAFIWPRGFPQRNYVPVHLTERLYRPSRG